MLGLGLGLSACGGSGQAAPVPGVTSEPCPQAVNPRHGCIYLGIISDLTSGPFKNLGPAFTKAQQKFWGRVNQQGGIGDYDIDATTYVRDSKYDVALHKKAFQELKDKVLALTQTLGSPTTTAILPDLRADQMVAVPASYTSAWEFQDVILESGASYCLEMMNGVDYAVAEYHPAKILAVRYDGDYGGDAAAGARFAARRSGVEFVDVVTRPGLDQQSAAIEAIVRQRPGLVTLTTGPADAVAIMDRAVARGFTGRFLGSNPTWNKALTKDDTTAKVVKEHYLLAAAFKPFAVDSPGHTAMRVAIGNVEPDDTYTSGWAWSYPLKAVLQKAADNHDLNRAGVMRALKQLTTVDYEGMLPADAGNFTGTGSVVAFKRSIVLRPDADELTGVKVVKDFFVGDTAKSFTLERPCYLMS